VWQSGWGSRGGRRTPEETGAGVPVEGVTDGRKVMGRGRGRGGEGGPAASSLKREGKNPFVSVVGLIGETSMIVEGHWDRFSHREELAS